MIVKMFVQACSLFGRPHEIQLNRFEQFSNITAFYITLNTVDIEFECEELTDDQFQEMRTAQIAKTKAKIMQDAQDQCDRLGE